ncbi:DUF2785 domain-containing protein [Streptomyces sp. NBC_00503]|uniref:DUF2785 domain-containing protein n=1 Tax=Streptomyces sp. NBC_00503 TaxID=2903659 RepID=UPI002E816260|nr:DUF2785 domain-containing protein [Streptomyces sp. NBC_00503]WUD85499.1 DUF2785 domain-containing protein [Streptomyces sp. NBC_00503]
MINWDSVIEDHDYAVPATRSFDDLVADLSQALADPDPEIRDGAPHMVLREWIARGVIDGPRRSALGDAMAVRFTDQEIQARTFAPLVLTYLVRAGDFRPGWLDAFADWFVTETDLRGYDDTIGWLHAVAHGADLLGAFGLRLEADPRLLLRLAATRLLTPTDHVLEQQEDDRLAKALDIVLARQDLTEQTVTAWLEPVAQAFRTLPRGPVPAWYSNTVRTLRPLYILVHRGPDRPCRQALTAALTEVLDLVDAR